MPPSDPVSLPPKLMQQFRALRWRLWQTRSAEWACLAGLSFLSLFLLVWLSDRLWDTPSAARYMLLIGMIIAAISMALWITCRWVLPMRRLNTLAKFVRAWDRRTGDRLLAAVALSSGDGQAMESARLREAAMAQLGDQLGDTDLTASIDHHFLKGLSTAVTVMVLLVGTLFLIAPHVCLNAAARCLLPWHDVPRYTFVQLVDLPDTHITPHGESTPFRVLLKADSPWKRHSGKATLLATGPALHATLENGGYTFALPGLVQEETLHLRVGDARASIRLLPKHRPGLERLEATVTLPDYLRRPAIQTEIVSGRLEAVTGSVVRLTGTVSRSLAEATLHGISSSSLPVNDRQFHTPLMTLDQRPQLLEIGWVDQLGLAAKEALRIELRSSEDRPPRVELLTGTSSTLALLAHDTIALGLRAEDDYGLQALGYVWGITGTTPETLWQTQGRLISEGGPETVTLDGDVTVAPQTLSLSPGTWQFWAYAQDYRPDAPPSFSSVKTVQVLTEAEHAAMVRAQFRQVQEQLESVSRDEANSLQANEALAQAAMLDPLALQAQQAAEEANTEQLKALTTQAQALLEQALKNDSIDTAAMDAWGNMLGAMQSVANVGMPGAAQSMGQAAGAAQGGNSSGAKEALAQAMNQQKQNLEQLAEAMGDAQETEEKLEAATFVNRLRRAATAEEQVAANMKASIFQSAGLAPAQLDTSAQTTLTALTDGHDTTRDEVSLLMNDLEHYHRRTSKPIYGQVHEEMAQAQTPNELTAITQRLQRNQHGRVIQGSLHWAKQFHAWADALSAPADEDEEPTPPGGGGESEGKQDTETLLAIMRLVQREMALRDQTRALDRRRDHDDYPAAAQLLSQEQRDMGFAVATLLARVFGPDIQLRLRAAGEAMSDAATLLEKPETGGETIAAETEVIELLGQAAKNSSQMSGNSKGMEALAELLALMEMGNSPGGNPEGAASFLASEAAIGTAITNGREERRVEKTSGYQSGDFPEEFREALGDYFERREALIDAAP